MPAIILVRAGLDKENAATAILGQSRGNHRPRRTGTDYDFVKHLATCISGRLKARPGTLRPSKAAATKNGIIFLHVGLSEVDVDQIERARSIVEIATIQNEYNLANRKHEAVLDFCESRGIGFIPFYPQRIGKLAESEALKTVAMRGGVTPPLIALAWLFKRSPAIVAIAGTSSVKHLDENVAASRVHLSPDVIALDGLVLC